jgi:hypothetical protein
MDTYKVVKRQLSEVFEFNQEINRLLSENGWAKWKLRGKLRIVESDGIVYLIQILEKE